ncbi:hypothetical protein [Streptomyces sp. A1136]|uniref:hypothetical protein n=1 Tax=Streptomyces sp. A1136 TaxID=2563102 RepID=UPI00109ED878|nr:hypothetical protein [Streptomyces sp. A1136]THA47495.1 hypothetical protein E6R62_31280 [Streptomyces sp. A1136]
MPEDELAQGEIAALTRRYENNLQILRGDIAGLDNRLMSVEHSVTGVRNDVHELREAFAGEVQALNDKMDRHQAQIVELLTQLVGKTPQ